VELFQVKKKKKEPEVHQTLHLKGPFVCIKGPVNPRTPRRLLLRTRTDRTVPRQHRSRSWVPQTLSPFPARSSPKIFEITATIFSHAAPPLIGARRWSPLPPTSSPPSRPRPRTLASTPASLPTSSRSAPISPPQTLTPSRRRRGRRSRTSSIRSPTPSRSAPSQSASSRSSAARSSSFRRSSGRVLTRAT
jgi:hypothetical protein